jgi:uncharacterized protein
MIMHYIVTGCSSGLGFEILKKLMENSCSVTGLSRKIGKAAVFEHNEKFEHIVCDMSLPDSVNQLDRVKTSVPVVLIINAAQFRYEGEELMETDDAREIFHVNYFSACSLIEKFIDNGLARVLFINSVAGVDAQPGQAQYSASKHALQAYSEALAKLSVGKGFDVMSINPGGMDTELWKNEDLLDRSVTEKFIKPSDFADLIWSFLCLPPKTYVKTAVILPEHDV